MAVPIYWVDLKKKGISNTGERKRSINRASKFLKAIQKVKQSPVRHKAIGKPVQIRGQTYQMILSKY